MIFFNIKTPLHLAVSIQNIEIVKLLLKTQGIDVNMKDIVKINWFYEIMCHFTNDFKTYLWRRPVDCTNNEEIIKLLTQWF